VGESGHPFTYVDVNGNNVSFSDFKGKVVYVDVWATWCAPCRAEIPHLKRLKEHFKDNQTMAIVGISSDKPADFEKWKKFIADHQLEGLQLWGGIEGDENIMKLYNIRSIPRFLLFDKDGKIVSSDAPRASSPEIIPLLTRLLQ
jgi:thiol-disulfide isomerase/thioredoxin